MKQIIKILSILYLLSFITISEAKQIKSSQNGQTTWCLHQKTTHHGVITEDKTTSLNVSEKDLKSAIDRLKKLYDTQKNAFAELNTKCVAPEHSLSPKILKTLQQNHIANKNGEIYDCYQKLVPLVFEITSINPPKSKFLTFEELKNTGVITKEKK